MAYTRPAAPQGRPDSIISDISDDGPDTAQKSRDYVPSISSDASFHYQRHPESSPSHGAPRGESSNFKARQGSDTGDANLSDIADAYRNQAMLANQTGRITPKSYQRGEVSSEVIEGLQDEVQRLRMLLEHETVKREEMSTQFKKWKDLMTHNTKAHIQNSKIDLHKNYMRIHPILNDDGEYPDMVVFPTTVGALMKMNEAHLTRLVVFYGLQSDPAMDYYAKYCALRDHLGIDP